MMRKVLLIEDDSDITELIQYNLKKNGFECICSDNANDGLIILEDIVIDIILLDIMLPGLKGMDFLNVLRRSSKYDHIPVIVISANNMEQDVIHALNSGADDYLPKPFSMDMLVVKINTILRRGIIKAKGESSVIVYKNIKIDKNTRKVTADSNEIKLTHKEYELLHLLISNYGKVFSREVLLNTIWSYNSDAFTRTIDSHIASLRKKLGSCSSIIKSISKIGYTVE